MRATSLTIVLLASGLFAAGCHGPLTRPMVQRLDEDSQAEVDESWNNMMASPERLNHTLLLDVILTSQFHQRGVDRLNMVSEKRVNDGWIIMEVRYDRRNPSFDAFTVTYVDKAGVERRRESYSREDIDTRIAYLYERCPEECQGGCYPEDQVTEVCRKAMEVREKEIEARMEEVAAATQPST